MNRKYIEIVLYLIFIFSDQMHYAQDDKAKAKKLASEAIDLIDKGDYTKATDLLNNAKRYDPTNFVYDYELAYISYIKKEYSKVIDMGWDIIKNYNTNDQQIYQLIGNSYDLNGNSLKAMETYQEGLNWNPNSGRLYLETGIIYYNKNRLDSAVYFFEKGIELEPVFSSNYYYAAKIYCVSTQPVWGVLYGELFLNIERNSDRSYEISKLLYDTYKKNIHVISEDKYEVTFYKMGPDEADEVVKFASNFEITLLFSIADVKPIETNLKSLAKIRSSFINLWKQKGFDSKYPNSLFEWHKKLNEKGYLTQYSYWLFQEGNSTEYKKYIDSEKSNYDKFVNWFSENPMKVSSGNSFYRRQY